MKVFVRCRLPTRFLQYLNKGIGLAVVHTGGGELSMSL